MNARPTSFCPSTFASSSTKYYSCVIVQYSLIEKMSLPGHSHVQVLSHGGSVEIALCQSGFVGVRATNSLHLQPMIIHLKQGLQ